MALKAGYYGIKKALLEKLESLFDSVVIKSIGDGLDLSAAGELSSTSTGGFDYSTSEVDTGQKWIDGRSIYCRVWDFGDSPLQISSGNTWVTFDNELRGVAGIINGYWMNTDLSTFNNGSFYADVTNTRLQILSTRTQSNIYVGKIVLFYVKAAAPAEVSATRSTKNSTKKTASADNE